MSVVQWWGSYLSMIINPLSATAMVFDSEFIPESRDRKEETFSSGDKSTLTAHFLLTMVPLIVHLAMNAKLLWWRRSFPAMNPFWQLGFRWKRIHLLLHLHRAISAWSLKEWAWCARESLWSVGLPLEFEVPCSFSVSWARCPSVWAHALLSVC